MKVGVDRYVDKKVTKPCTCKAVALGVFGSCALPNSRGSGMRKKKKKSEENEAGETNNGSADVESPRSDELA